MDTLLDYIFLDNTIRAYLIVVGSVLMALLLKRIISKYLAVLLYKVIKRISKGVEQQTFINLVVQPMEVFIVILITIVALDKLNFPKELDLSIYRFTLRGLIDTLSVSTLIVTFIWLLLRVIDFVALILEQKASRTPDQADDQLIVFFRDFLKAILVIIGGVLILKFGFHKNVGSLLTGLSIATAAIALSTKESLENLIASFIIFFDKPFTVGDVVKVQNITGSVEKIGLRSTRIRTDQKTFVTVPNKQMVDSIMDNLTLRSQRRADIRLTVSLSTPPETMQELVNGVKEIIKKKDLVESFAVFFSEIGSTGFVVPIEYYTATIAMDEFNALKQEINLEVLQLLQRLKVDIAGINTDIRIINDNSGGPVQQQPII